MGGITVNLQTLVPKADVLNTSKIWRLQTKTKQKKLKLNTKKRAYHFGDQLAG